MDDPIIVRRATVSDAADISMLYLHFLRSYGHDSERESIVRFLEYILAEPWAFFFVATDVSHKIVGFAGCTLTYSVVLQGTAISINDMFVDAVARRRGVGTALCAAVEAHARLNGCVKLFLMTAPDAEAAITMYKKAGFEIQPYLEMAKGLSNA